ncbi:MAG TPA: radical SAM family heme chaperone HemW [Actinomycetes bacterium]|nr:radical SAM family heme chaperone HemW [Actinomycetes bacterium]
MPHALPAGDPAPADGSLPEQARADVGRRSFGVYVHVPFCATRCGYCDFNTYTAGELGGSSPGSYVESALAEVRLARSVLGDQHLPVSTVFVGGGTPTLLSSPDLARLLAAVLAEFGSVSRPEVTTEANPESVTAGSLAQLREAGFTRVSFGMQSAVPHVLEALDRTHTPGRVVDAVGWARAAGFDDVSLDLIYGAPGESLADWQVSVDAAVALAPEHISAYALIVEEGTKLAAQIRRGELRAPDDDEQADKYLLADESFGAAGLRWYEVSNWSRGDRHVARHNIGYWHGDDWWGIGPGAHSHVAGVRWWNVKHPAAYAGRLADGRSPAAGRELLTDKDRRVERVMLELRTSDGLPAGALDERARGEAAVLAGDGLLDQGSWADGVARLTQRGRLLADLVVRRLVS